MSPPGRHKGETRRPQHEGTPVNARPPRWGARGIGLGLLVLVVASFASLDLRWREFASANAVARMLAFAASFFPPEHSPAFLSRTAYAALETLAMSMVGTALAAIGGLILALPASGLGIEGASRLRSAGAQAGASPRPSATLLRHAVGHAGRRFARLALNLLRSVPELVWAVLLLIAAGLGPFSGTLALALHTTGVLGRLFAESIENAPPGPSQSLRVRGIGGGRVFVYATLPQIAPQVVAYSLYRWENNIRAAAVLGVVGAGGLGQMLAVHLSLFQTREAGTVLIAMIALVLAVDALSGVVRRRMAS
jgi:phosphonate transport system permease protein